MNKFSQHFKSISFESKSYRSIYFCSAILLLLIVNVCIRLFPDVVHPNAEAKLESKAIVRSQISKKIKTTLLQKSPGLSDYQATQIAQKTMASQFDANNPEIKSSEKKLRKILLDKKMSSPGLPLLGADPYYYLGLTSKYLQTGRLWDKRKGRDYFNPMMLAPTGCYYPIDLHPIIGGFVHQSMSFFNKSLSLEQTTRWTPIILSLFTLLGLIGLGIYAYHLSTAAILVGSLHLMIVPIYLKRSLIGWYDTDPYNVLFPLLITALLGLISTKAEIQPKIRYFLATFAGITILLYSLFWRGWSLACFFLFAVAVICALLQSFFKNIRLRTSIASLSIALAIPISGSLLLWGVEGLKQELTSFQIFTNMLRHSSFPIWPDVFITVGELRSAGWLKASFLSGGLISVILTFGLLGIQFSKKMIKEKCFDAQTFYLALVCLGVLFFSVSVERFALLAAAPLSIGFMVASQYLSGTIASIMRRILTSQGQKVIMPFIPLFTTALLLISLCETSAHAYKQIYKFRPIYNTSWDRMMNQVSANTPINSIITTWWSPGHFITSKGRRSVSIDGATQNETRAYWIARLFMETSEPASIGILRMLNSSGESLQNSMINAGLETSDSVRLINQILPLPKIMAQNIFHSKFEKKLADDLIDIAFPQEKLPPSYLFIYKHMMDQVQALEYVGFWDFKKSEIFNRVIEQHPDKVPPKSLKKGTKEYVKVLWSMTKPPTPTPSEGHMTQTDTTSTVYSNGVSIGNKADSIRIHSDAFGQGKPAWIYFVQNNALQKIRMDNPNANTAVFFIGDNLSKETLRTASKTVLIHPRLADSIAARLYWLDGAGLKFMTHVSTEDDITKSSRFVLYEINWDAYFQFMEDVDRKMQSRQ